MCAYECECECACACACIDKGRARWLAQLWPVRVVGSFGVGGVVVSGVEGCTLSASLIFFSAWINADSPIGLVGMTSLVGVFAEVRAWLRSPR